MRKILAFLLFALMMVYMPASFAEGCYGEEVTRSTVEMVANVDTKLRLWATFDGPVYDVLLEGESVEVCAFCPDSSETVWAAVMRADPVYRYGYIDMKDLYCLEDRTFEFSEFMKVTGNTVNIREYESINAPISGLLYKNEIVQVMELVPTSDGRVWAECYTADESAFLGWVSTRYLVKADFNSMR